MARPPARLGTAAAATHQLNRHLIMFRRVTPEGWIHFTSILGFLLTFLVFLGAVIRAWRLRRDTADHLSRLPLDSEQHASDTQSHE